MFRSLTLALAAAGLLFAPAAAQNTDKLVVTSGTSFQKDGVTRAYMIWQPGDITTTLGMRFGIYRKEGGLASANPYTRVGIQTLQSNPETIRALFRLGDQVDFHPGMVAERIAGIYSSTVVGTPMDNGPDETLGAAGKLSYLIQAAVEEPDLLNQLLLLGRAHPGVMMALGHGFAIEMPAASVQTFEIRQLDGADQVVRVVGRVEIDSAAPGFAPPPGPPVAVPYPVLQTKYVHSPKDHLNARLRWGQDPALRREMAATFGFDLFRVREDCAVMLGWNVTPPTRQELADLLTGTVAPPPECGPGDIARVNGLPIMIDPPLTLAEAADPSDRETFYYTDDNGLAHGGLPFADGDTFYYFVATRDICGRPGEVSPGTRVVMCDRQPPLPPRILSVDNVFAAPDNPADWQTLEGKQHLRVRIEQLDENDPGEAATRYHVYRWMHPREALLAPGDPSVNRVGIVDHVPGQAFVNFDDDGAGAPSMPANADVTYWYTVRAEDDTSCVEKNFSAHSGAVYGVLRDRAGPDAPSGSVSVCRHVPQVEFFGTETGRRDLLGITDENPAFIVRVKRDSPAIRYAEIEVRGPDAAGAPGGELLESRLIYFGNSDERDELFRHPETSGHQICVRARTFAGLWSGKACHNPNGEVGKGALNIYRFIADTDRVCEDPGGDPDDVVDHEPLDLDGSIDPITGTIVLPAGTFEWRVYRRINLTGPLTLIAKAEGEGLPSPAPWDDDSMPYEPGTIICYYLQVFDEHGNASVLIRVKCVRIIGEDMPQPMLSEAELQLGPGGESLALLTWFCDPVGVERFELLVAAEASDDPGVTGTAISDDLGSPTVPIVLGGEFEDREMAIYQSRRVGSSTFGEGPEFSTLVEIPAGQRLFFAVRAVGDGPFNQRTAGDPSNIVEATWVTPEELPQPVIPWPARPLPSLQKTERNVLNYLPGEGPYLATPLPSQLDAAGGIVMGAFEQVFEFTSDGTIGWLPETPLPMEHLFRFRPQGGGLSEGTLLPSPFVVYRYQVPNSEFPEAVPNLVQVSPLIDRMAYKKEEPKDGSAPYHVVRDPFFRFVQLRGSNVPVALDGIYGPDSQPVTGTPDFTAPLPPYLEDKDGLIIWIDPMPYIKQASYRYLIVRLDPDSGEISRVIPTNVVEP